MTWQTVKDFFLNPLTVLIIGIAVTIIVAVIVYKISKKDRKPTYYIKSHNLIIDFSSKITKLKMIYDNKQIERLTVSKIAFWNDGKETINFKNNVVESDPLRIESIGEYEILDAKVIKETSQKINEFSLETINNKLVRIKFNILDKGQGVAIQVIHTGKVSTDIKLDGYIEGAGKPQPSYTRDIIIRIFDKIISIQKQPQPIKPQPVKARRVFAFALFGASLIVLVIAFSDMSIPAIIFGIVFFFIYAYLGYSMLKRRVPKDLEIVEEEEI